MSMWCEIVGYIAGAVAIAGVVLNNRKLRACFLLWMASNAMSMWLHVVASMWSLSIRDGIFLMLAVEGWYRWTEKGEVT